MKARVIFRFANDAAEVETKDPIADNRTADQYTVQLEC